MLTLKLISEETERVIKGLEKKHFAGAREAIEKVLEYDKLRRESQQQLDSMPFVRETRFVSKAQGSKEMADMLGEDFLNVFESTPIPVSIDVSLKAGYVSADSLKLVE